MSSIVNKRLEHFHNKIAVETFPKSNKVTKNQEKTEAKIHFI